VLNFLVFIFLPLSLFPLHHCSLFLLFANAILSLVLANLLKDVSLGLFDELFFQFALMLLPSHPLFMRDGIC
jgi:hypothetical protein